MHVRGQLIAGRYYVFKKIQKIFFDTLKFDRFIRIRMIRKNAYLLNSNKKQYEILMIQEKQSFH